MNAWLTPDTPSGSTVRRVLVIPDTYLSSVNGALEQLTEIENWEAYGSETTEDAIAAMGIMVEDYYVTPLIDAIQPQGTLSMLTRLSPESNPVAWNFDGSQPLGGYWNWTITAIDNNHVWSIAGNAGDDLYISGLMETANNCGSVSWMLDGVLFATWDTYSASVARGVVMSGGPGSFLLDGIHELEAIVASKNPSSTNYQFRLTEAAFRIETP